MSARPHQNIDPMDTKEAKGGDDDKGGFSLNNVTLLNKNTVIPVARIVTSRFIDDLHFISRAFIRVTFILQC